MTVNGKRDDFTLDDLLSVASQVRGMDARRIIEV
jgi:serine/threonine-protein kinase HipA